ncbi:hypothetical protein JCM5353_007469 [Sporobolomyces roseus]
MRRPHSPQKRSLILPIVFLSLSTPSFAFLPSLNPRSSSTLTSLVSTSSSNTSSYSAPLNSGRFGHSSLYLPPPLNQLLLLGGQLQLSTNSTTNSRQSTTNSVLEFRLETSYLYGQERPLSAIPNNPSESTSYDKGFKPSSFVAGGVDYHQDLIYLIGGTREGGGGDCQVDGQEDQVIQSFNLTSLSSTSTSWESPKFSPRLPPRRRQAQLLSTTNSSTLSNDLWVLGGISDSTTSSSCSSTSSGDSSPLGYLGIDHYSPSSGTVESFKWDVPPEDWEGDVPVSDYSSQVLRDGTSFVVFGGQTTMGDMVAMDKVLVFNTELRQWYTKNVTGDIPPSRMGQVSLTLSTTTSSSSSNSSLSDTTSSSPIFVHGGLSPSSNATESIFSDSYLLLPPPSTDLSPFSPEGEWIWKKLIISNNSMNSPQLAYHAASQVLGGTIVVSFGITNDSEQGEEKVSDEIWFLSVDVEEGTFSWKDTWQGNSDALKDQGMVESEQRRLRKRGLIVEPIQQVTKGSSMVKRVEIIANPKAYSMKQTASTSSSSSVTPVETTWSSQSQPQQGGSGIVESQVQLPSSSTPLPSSSPSSSTSSKIIVQSPSSSPLASSPKSHASSSSPSSTTLGASIGGTLGAIALLSLAVVLIRRSRNSRTKIPSTPQMMNSSFSGPPGGGGGGGGGGPPLVSSLMYTRPLHTRQLSLGSTISELPSPAPSTQTSTIRNGPVTDPFSDDYNVNEHGQLSRQVSSTSTTRGIAEVGGVTRPSATRDGPGVLERSKSSVTSIPFLSTIALHPSSPLTPSRDSYTSPARTLSLRRTSGMTIPGTPAELIGLAVTSDDGHDQITYGLPYRAPSTTSGVGGGKEEGGKEEGWENFLKKSSNEFGMSGLGMTQEVEEEEGGIPAILRPATPAAGKSLKVRNADPFIDQ